jgi:hypothetical protein
MVQHKLVQFSRLEDSLRKNGRGKVLLTVPLYQRKFVWFDEESKGESIGKEFVQKLATSEANEASFFLGSLILVEKGIDGESVSYEVVDGQQRLATLFLIKNIIDKQNSFNPKTTLCSEYYGKGISDPNAEDFVNSLLNERGEILLNNLKKITFDLIIYSDKSDKEKQDREEIDGAKIFHEINRLPLLASPPEILKGRIVSKLEAGNKNKSGSEDSMDLVNNFSSHWNLMLEFFYFDYSKPTGQSFSETPEKLSDLLNSIRGEKKVILKFRHRENCINDIQNYLFMIGGITSRTISNNLDPNGKDKKRESEVDDQWPKSSEPKNVLQRGNCQIFLQKFDPIITDEEKLLCFIGVFNTITDIINDNQAWMNLRRKPRSKWIELRNKEQAKALVFQQMLAARRKKDWLLQNEAVNFFFELYQWKIHGKQSDINKVLELPNIASQDEIEKNPRNQVWNFEWKCWNNILENKRPLSLHESPTGYSSELWNVVRDSFVKDSFVKDDQLLIRTFSIGSADQEEHFFAWEWHKKKGIGLTNKEIDSVPNLCRIGGTLNTSLGDEEPLVKSELLFGKPGNRQINENVWPKLAISAFLTSELKPSSEAEYLTLFRTLEEVFKVERKTESNQDRKVTVELSIIFEK